MKFAHYLDEMTAQSIKNRYIVKQMIKYDGP